MKKETTATAFEKYISKATSAEKNSAEAFFADLCAHCLINSSDRKRLREDFEKAIMYYINSGKRLTEALALLDVKYLGGFYARPAVLWFPLDDAAKIYPLSMEHGRMSVFRISVYLKAPIIPELLQMALNFTIKRFPSFATTLKKGFFWHYLDTAKRRFCAEPESDIPCRPLKVSLSGSQSFRVLYFGNRISLEFFHVLTDGTGALTFLKVLTAEYLRLCGVNFIPDENLWDINDTPHSEEFENTFARIPKSANASGFMDKPALQMNGKLTATRPCRVLHFKMNTSELKAAAAKYDASITAYLLAAMFLSAKAATDEINGELSFQLPVNMRKYYPSKTVKNFSMYCGIRLPINTVDRIENIIGEIKSQIEAKTAKPVMSEMITSADKLVNMLKWIPLAVKQPVAKKVYGFLGDNIFTSTLSNMGVVNMPKELSEQIDSMDFVLGTAITNRLDCSLISINDTATFSIYKITADPSFEEKMYGILCRDGITVTAEGSELYGY